MAGRCSDPRQPSVPFSHRKRTSTPWTSRCDAALQALASATTANELINLANQAEILRRYAHSGQDSAWQRRTNERNSGSERNANSAISSRRLPDCGPSEKCSTGEHFAKIVRTRHRRSQALTSGATNLGNPYSRIREVSKEHPQSRMGDHYSATIVPLRAQTGSKEELTADCRWSYIGSC